MCWDIKVASPSFERIDLDELIKRIDMSLQEGNRVVFFDIGAQFGKYTVALAHRFKKYANKLKIYSFEPDPECFQLLQSNIRLNKLTNIKAVRSALSDKAGIQKFYYYKPQRMIVSFRTDQIIQIRTTTLDTFVKKISNLNKSELYIKLDVEGHEMKALKGAKNTINKATNSFLMIEDFSSNARKLIPYLSAHGVMLVKNSPMNSFWKLVS
jgi:FkbM family methyltransferase